MIQAMGRLFQQVITTLVFSGAILYYSPVLLLALIACLVPAFLGESHFAFLNYALNFRQTPVKRELDYLRQVGGSKEAAKELKLFGLSDFLTNRFTLLSDQILARESQALTSAPAGRYTALDPQYSRLLRQLCLDHLRTAMGRASYGDFVFLTACRYKCPEQHLTAILDPFRDRRSGSFPYRSARVF